MEEIDEEKMKESWRKEEENQRNIGGNWREGRGNWLNERRIDNEDHD